MTRKRPIVCVFGSNDAQQGDLDYEFARGVGKALGGLGYVVANGGYAGTMEASARGAKEAGGPTIAVTCKVWNSPANQYMDEVVQTCDLFDRVRRLIDMADGGFVVLPGGTGTLVELNSGEVGVVVEQTFERRLKPKVMVVLGKNKKPLKEPYPIDLFEDYAEKLRQIEKIKGAKNSIQAVEIVKDLEPGSFDIDIASIRDAYLKKSWNWRTFFTALTNK